MAISHAAAFLTRVRQRNGRHVSTFQQDTWLWVAEPELPSRLVAGWQLKVRCPTLQDMGQGADPAH